MSKYKKWRYIIQYVKPTANWCLKIDFQKVDQHAGGKWLIHDTKRRKDNQLQSLKLPMQNWIQYFSERKKSILAPQNWHHIIHVYLIRCYTQNPC